MSPRRGCNPSLRAAKQSIAARRVWIASSQELLAMTARLRANQRKSVFGQRQDLPDADLDRNRLGNEFGPLAGFAFDGVDGVEADVEFDALRDQALDAAAVGIFGAQQIDPGT